MHKKNQHQKGFTLIELLVVISIIVIISIYGAGTLSNSTGTLNFQSQVERVAGLIREARTLSLTGVSVPDYTDFDEDNTFYPHPPQGVECTQGQYVACTNLQELDPSKFDCECDTEETIVAAGIGIYVEESLDGGKMYFFTDMHNNSEGSFDPFDSDPSLTSLDFSDKSDIIIGIKTIDFTETDYSIEIKDDDSEMTMIYAPPYGELKLIGDASGNENKVTLIIRDKNDSSRASKISVHQVSGIPEIEPLNSFD